MVTVQHYRRSTTTCDDETREAIPYRMRMTTIILVNF